VKSTALSACTGKPRSRYRNDPASYKCLVDLLTRARLEGRVPMEAIDDETRPVALWNVFPNVQEYIAATSKNLFKNYWRDLLASQPNHVELVVEMNTVAGIVRPLAAEFCLTMTSGRGYCSLPPRAAIARRHLDSGKAHLVLIVVADLDPDGEGIVNSLGKSLRDDFGVDELTVVKAALTGTQVQERNLPHAMEAKTTSTRYAAWRRNHGDAGCHELEALAPDDLLALVRESILSVLDIDLLNEEQATERADNEALAGVRTRILANLRDDPVAGGAL
jgi:hypothetical protein